MQKFKITRSELNNAVSKIENPYLLKNIFISVYNKSHEDELEQQIGMCKAMNNEVIHGGYGEAIAFPNRDEMNIYKNMIEEMKHSGCKKSIAFPNENTVLTYHHYYVVENDALFWYIRLVPNNIDDIQSVKIDYDALTDALYGICADSDDLRVARLNRNRKMITDIFEYMEKETVAVTIMLDGKIIDKKDVKIMRTERTVTWNDLKK